MVVYCINASEIYSVKTSKYLQAENINDKMFIHSHIDSKSDIILNNIYATPEDV